MYLLYFTQKETEAQKIKLNLAKIQRSKSLSAQSVSYFDRELWFLAGDNLLNWVLQWI